MPKPTTEMRKDVRSMRLREIVQAWVIAFNRAAIDALSAFYREDAIYHHVVESPY